MHIIQVEWVYQHVGKMNLVLYEFDFRVISYYYYQFYSVFKTHLAILTLLIDHPLLFLIICHEKYQHLPFIDFCMYIISQNVDFLSRVIIIIAIV